MSTKRQTFLPTKDLDLVMIETRDAKLILTWFHNPEVNIFLNLGQFPITTEFEKKYISKIYQDKSKLQLGIYHRKDRRLIGTVGIHRICDIHLQGSFGIAIGDRKYWGKGYGTQALKAMLDWSFKVRGLRIITLDVLGSNPRAIKCYKNCGFKHIGTIPKSVFKDGRWVDRCLMIIRNPLIK